MNEQTQFDVIIIGAGPAGYCAAIRLAQLGFSTVVAEKNARLGGTCLNVGCIPSKALLDSSDRFAMARNGLARHGIKVDAVTLDLGVMMERKERIVASFTEGIETLFRQNRIARIRGAARFIGPREIEIESNGAKSVLRAAKAIIIATGSIPSGLTSLPFDDKTVVDSSRALSFDAIPRQFAIIGGGAIGVELASVWARLGSNVTIVEHMPQLLPGWDFQASRLLKRVLTRQGITVVTDATVEDAILKDHAILLSVRAQDSLTEVIADRVLIAIGRKPYTEELGLDKIGIPVDSKSGRIPINGQFMTPCNAVYAIGDCVEGPMLAHKAFDEGIAVAENIAGRSGHVNYATVPGVVYTAPEIAYVGETEEQLKARGIAYKSGSFPFRANGRAMALDATEGFVKIVSDAATDAVLGVHIIGPCASELIAEAVSIMEFGGSSEDIARTIHAHPTLSEVIREAALDIDKRALHKFTV